ncbi:hypothetical protein MBM_07259 [Drepanopeziza brunnea f. sp. 'multigermtubi' MB_m1]|uniref:RING-type domain-containing protein n=2 Tax=Drepanopeziza brunnea f. sp. 'multigermtubi' TaxID=698441 RepID=K1X102_MARBU|nr:uncharacterized protein MBM_07259 [Drepanopeziza brunnea f. sp. 'multigermtubi' MB_m1]EKD14538.1 hypothetical protein MBM_07259 [Drepanopeziza brunnea f. sp. 'multigermtubi' MB_m1]
MLLFCPECFQLPDPRVASIPTSSGQPIQGPELFGFVFGAAQQATTAKIWARAQQHLATYSAERLSIFAVGTAHSPPEMMLLIGIQRRLICDFWRRLDTPAALGTAERALILQLQKAIEHADMRFHIWRAERARERAERERFRSAIAHVAGLGDLKPGEERDCAICKTDLWSGGGEEGEQPVRLNVCQHLFGEKCILDWLQLAGNCPLCRRTVDPGAPVPAPALPLSDSADEDDEDAHNLFNFSTNMQMSVEEMRLLLGQPSYFSPANPPPSHAVHGGEGARGDDDDDDDDGDDEADELEDLPAMPLWMRILLSTRAKRDLEFLFMVDMPHHEVQANFAASLRPANRGEPGGALCPISRSTLRFIFEGFPYAFPVSRS